MANVTVQKNQPAPATPSAPAAPRDVTVADPFRLMRALLGWDPFQEMMPLASRIETFSPAFDVKETKEAYTFTADVPGVKDADLEISLSGNRMTVSGKRESEKEEKTDRTYTRERSYGSFLRTFTLPDDADGAATSADLKNGVLSILVKKRPEAQPKKIAIGTPGKTS